jgi:hypothetical protein
MLVKWSPHEVSGPDSALDADVIQGGHARAGRPGLLLLVLLAAAVLVTRWFDGDPTRPSGRLPIPAVQPLVGSPVAPSRPPPRSSLLVRTYDGVHRISLGSSGSATSRPLAPGGASTSLTSDGAVVLDDDGRRASSLPATLLGAPVDLGPGTAVLPADDPRLAWVVDRRNGTLRQVRVSDGAAAGARYSLPSGWWLRAVTGGRLVLTRDLDSSGHEQIGVRDPVSGDTDLLTSSGYYLSASRAQVAWLDPGCPVTACHLHIATVRPAAGPVGGWLVAASNRGATFDPGPAAFADGSLALFGTLPGGSTGGALSSAGSAQRVLLVVRLPGRLPGRAEPPPYGHPEVRVVPGSAEASVAGGLRWSGDLLLFGVSSAVAESAMQPAYWSPALAGPARRFGPPQPPEARVLDAQSP